MKSLVFGIIIVGLFTIIFLIVLVTTKEIWNKHKQATNSIKNYNSTMTAFAYKTPLTKQEIISAISMRNVRDGMKYEFNPDNFTIKFSRYGEHSMEYQITVIEAKNFSIVKIIQTNTIFTNNVRIYLLQNPFWIQKIKAEPVPYDMYFK